MTTTLGYTDDKLTSFGGTAIAYNAMGCPTSYDGKTATWTKGKLSRLSKGSRAAGMEAYIFNYNALGQRTSKSYSYTEGTSGISSVYSGMLLSSSKQFYYDHAGRLIAEISESEYYNDGSQNEKIVYLYDEGTIIGMAYTQGTVTNTYYFHRNPMGDVIGIYDMGYNLVAKYLYDAWGNCTISGETTNYAVARANPIRYRGYYYDDETGLYYCNARYYSPKWRRFISPDNSAINPSAVNGLNAYVYAGNNPVNVVYLSANTAHSYYGVMAAPFTGGTNNIASGVSNEECIPCWVGNLLTGVSSIHGFVDSISSYVAGTADGLLSYIGASKLNNIQAGLSGYSNWLLGIGIGLDVLSSAYKNYTNPNLTAGQKWASFGADVGYIAVKSGLSYLAGSLVTKGAVALGYAAMGATFGASIGGVTIGLGAIAIGASVVVLGVIAGMILITVLSDAADNWWEIKKEEWFS